MDNGKKTGYAIFLDIDDTLYFDGRVSEDNVREIRRVQEMGNRVFINTGRAKGFCPPGVLECGIRFDGFLCNYNYVEIEGRVLMSRYLSRKLVRRLLDFSLSTGTPIFLEGDRDCYSTIIDYKRHERLTDIESFMQSELSDIMTKVLFIKQMTDQDKALFPELEYIHFPLFTDAYIAGGSKAKLIRRTIEELGIPVERTIAFGDSENDIPMLGFVNTSVIVKGDTPKLEGFPASIITEGEPTTAVARTLRELFPN